MPVIMESRVAYGAQSSVCGLKDSAGAVLGELRIGDRNWVTYWLLLNGYGATKEAATIALKKLLEKVQLLKANRPPFK